MHDTQPVLRIRNAHKSYGSAKALRGVNLDLYAGELLGFLGPNGAGKTTLIRCLAGRARLDRGAIRFGDDQARTLGIVPQTLAMYEDLTVAQNMRVFGRLHGVQKFELVHRIKDVLDWVNLYDRQNHLVKTLSGGMQRRLNIACSVLHQPRILLLDEPTVGVDPQSRERIYELLQDLQQDATAILLTTHQLDEAQFRCDRIAIVDHGQVVRCGTFDELVGETIGTEQRLEVQFRRAAREPVLPLQLDSTRSQGTCLLTDVADELPRLLDRLHAKGEQIDGIVLRGPTLQDVFLNLTGKDLRE